MIGERSKVMNFRTSIAAVTCCAGLLAALLAGAASVGNTLLSGSYAVIATRTCLISQYQFNTNPITPQMPEYSYTDSASLEGIWTFDGSGSLTNTMTVVDISSEILPDSVIYYGNHTAESGSGRYKVAADRRVVVKLTQTWTASNVSYSDSFALAGHASSDGATVTLATPEAVVDTILPGPQSPQLFEVCHRAFTLLKQ
jgi:hypothetical protein